jgi:hypothetical protein
MGRTVRLHDISETARRPPADEPPRARDEASSLERLRAEVADGLMYAHSRSNANTSKVLEVAAFSYALIELLAETGVITIDQLDERKRIVGQRLADQLAEKGIGVALTKDEQDKYAHQSGAPIDCANRIPLCGAACCRLRFALSVQDLEEGTVKWDLGRPYMIRHSQDGYCHHLDRDACRCAIYDRRPIVCRSYDCRTDSRIWADFDRRIVNPKLDQLFSNQQSPAAAPIAGRDVPDVADASV